MTWVDLVVLGLVAVSGLLALARGFVREVLGLSAWAGAAAFTYWGLPLARPQFARWISSPEWVVPVTGAALFLGSLLVLMVVSGWIGGVVRGSRLGGLDRTLGLVFGLARGALLVVFAYIAVGMVIPIDQWPGVVQRARALPLAYEGAVWVVAKLPPGARPHVSPPPVERQTTAEELLRAQPLGRAVGPPTAAQVSPGQMSPGQASPGQMSPGLIPPRVQTRN
jgi:membrane protein required for colicin V production